MGMRICIAAIAVLGAVLSPVAADSAEPPPEEVVDLVEAHPDPRWRESFLEKLAAGAKEAGIPPRTLALVSGFLSNSRFQGDAAEAARRFLDVAREADLALRRGTLLQRVGLETRRSWEARERGTPTRASSNAGGRGKSEEALRSRARGNDRAPKGPTRRPVVPPGGGNSPQGDGPDDAPDQSGETGGAASPGGSASDGGIPQGRGEAPSP